MKKITFLLSTLLLFGWSWMGISCSDDDDPAPEPEPAPENEKSELEQDYFNIDEGTYVAGEFPVATSEEPIEGLNINSQALKGGMNFITVVSEKAYQKFFVGVMGVPGYFEYVPEEESEPQPETRNADMYHTYSIPIMYSTEFGEDITMLICAMDMEGAISPRIERHVAFVESLSGDLNVNLTFSNAKDVDLHLYTPSGEHIYYGNRGGDILTEDDTLSYGLDHDSNPNCYIDSLNNENIYIPGELIEPGEYRIEVNMYRNCDRSIPTYWSIAARYKGEFVPVSFGENPANGVYPVDAGDDDFTVAMKFTILEAAHNDVRSLMNRAKFIPFPMTDAEILKVEEASLK